MQKITIDLDVATEADADHYKRVLNYVLGLSPATYQITVTPETPKIKWPKGATVQPKSGALQFRIVDRDVYEGDNTFRILEFAGLYNDPSYQRVEIKVVD